MRTTVTGVSDDLAPAHDVAWYLGHLTVEGERFAAAIDRGPLDADILACPGWDLRRLAVHLGVIHRWAQHCALDGAPPNDTSDFEPGEHELHEWFVDGLRSLVDTLHDIDADGPTWHPFPVDQVGRVWPRRQAHETAMHRWDAERAIGEPTPFDPTLASDGIDEYFELSIPRLLVRERIELPTGSLHVHCTDVDGEWLVWNDGGEYRMKRAHEKGDAALRGAAEAILLRLWGRESASADDLSPVGDDRVLADWLAIAGM